MHPPFYTAPFHRAPSHPVPPGVKSVPRRGAAQRLDLSLPPPGFPLEAHVPVRPADPIPPRGLPLRVRIGHLLIRLGRALAPEAADHPGPARP
ncbi:MAG: hypothetical protein HLUCCA08_06210 [Rhodobacteraceae bacterium HLUCCA08]|nr:MAG: hypothetical protein HLUCCA08_06210 [Rhodobacteraceae bacterium HLUCCA08]